MIGDKQPKRQPKKTQKSDRTLAEGKKGGKQNAGATPYTGRPFKRPKTTGGGK